MFTRRRFMTSAGAALVAAPFLQYLGHRPARAQGQGSAKRLLVFFSPDGIVPQLWRPLGGENDYRFGTDSLLTPLNDYRSDLLVLDGIDFLTGNNTRGAWPPCSPMVMDRAA